jgi:hypothetical protein
MSALVSALNKALITREQHMNDRISHAVLIKVPSLIEKPPKAIFDALCNNKLVSDKDIKRICQFKRKTNWLVVFQDNVLIENLFGKRILFGTYEAELLDPNVEVSSYTAAFRVHWLPINYSASKLVQIIKEEIKPIAVEANWERFNGTQIENGILRIKIKVKKEEKNSLNGFSGKVPLGDRYVYITKVGEKPSCFYCNELGHTKAACEKWKKDQVITCYKCKAKGHVAAECNLAKQIASNNNGQQLNEDLDEQDAHADMFDFSDKNNSNKQSTPAANRMHRQSNVTNTKKDLSSRRGSDSSLPMYSNFEKLRVECQRNMANVFSTTAVKRNQPDENSPLKNNAGNNKKTDFLEELNETNRIYNETTIVDCTVMRAEIDQPENNNESNRNLNAAN